MSVSSHNREKKKEGEAKEDTDDEDDVLEWAMPLAPEERERERPRMLYLWKKELGECLQAHSFPQPVVRIGEGACTWSGFRKPGRPSLAGFVLVTGEGLGPSPGPLLSATRLRLKSTYFV